MRRPTEHFTAMPVLVTGNKIQSRSTFCNMVVVVGFFLVGFFFYQFVFSIVTELWEFTLNTKVSL